MKIENRLWLRTVAAISILLGILNGYQLVINASQQERITVLQSQVSFMDQSCRSFYTRLQSNVGALGDRASTLASTLLGQIREDNATIANLNSTKPPGYQNVTAILKAEIEEDQSIIVALNNLVPISNAGLSSGVTSFPCQ